MSVGALVMAMTIGSALIALWSYLRWPSAAPRTVARAILYVLIGFAALQAAARLLPLADGAPETVAPLLIVAIIIPALSYALLAALWFLRLFAAALKGFT